MKHFSYVHIISKYQYTNSLYLISLCSACCLRFNCCVWNKKLSCICHWYPLHMWSRNTEKKLQDFWHIPPSSPLISLIRDARKNFSFFNLCFMEISKSHKYTFPADPADFMELTWIWATLICPYISLATTIRTMFGVNKCFSNACDLLRTRPLSPSFVPGWHD